MWVMQVKVEAGLQACFQAAAAREHQAADQVLGRLMSEYVGGPAEVAGGRLRGRRNDSAVRDQGGPVAFPRFLTRVSILSITIVAFCRGPRVALVNSSKGFKVRPELPEVSPAVG